jgi:hypothetical protein
MRSQALTICLFAALSTFRSAWRREGCGARISCTESSTANPQKRSVLHQVEAQSACARWAWLLMLTRARQRPSTPTRSQPPQTRRTCTFYRSEEGAGPAPPLVGTLHVFACRACWSLVTPDEVDLTGSPTFASLHMLLLITYLLLRYPMAFCVHSMGPFSHIIGNSFFEHGTFITASLCLVFRCIALGASLRDRL